MTRFVLIPGAGGAAWYWHRVVPLLQAAGHEAIAVDFPADDEEAGLHVYVDLTVAACGSHPDVRSWRSRSAGSRHPSRPSASTHRRWCCSTR